MKKYDGTVVKGHHLGNWLEAGQLEFGVDGDS